MNSVSFLLPTATSHEVSPRVNHGSEQESSSFQTLLHTTIASAGTKQSLNESNSEVSAFAQMLIEVNPEVSLDVFLSLLSDELPLPFGYLTMSDSLEDILAQLPEELKQQLEKLFTSNVAIEQILGEYEQTESPLHLVAALLFFNDLQASGRFQFSGQQQQTLERFMQQLTTANNGQQLPAELKELISRLLQQQRPNDETRQTVRQNHAVQFVEQTVLSRQETTSQGLSIHTFASNETMSRAEQMTIHVGEQLTKKAEHHQFQRQFQEMLNRGMFRNLQNGMNQLSIKLHPEHLGRLDIQITQLNGVITARIMASTAVAKELIEGQLHQLRQAFALQQLQVEKIEITQQEQPPLFQSERDEQQKGHEQRDEKQSGEQTEDETFSQLLEEFTFMEEV